MKYFFIALQIPFFIRFLLEFSEVNAFIEPVNSLRRYTNPLVLPMKRVIPLSWAKKFAAEKVAFIIAIIGGVVAYRSLILGSIILHVEAWIIFLQYGIFIYVIGSWIQTPKFQRANYVLHHIFEPIFRPIRKVIPPIGGVVDISPIILLFGMSFASDLFFNLIRKIMS